MAAINNEGFVGWPFVNYAMDLRSTKTERGPGRTTIVYPRKKFTYVVEFVINPRALDPNRMQTNLLEFLNNGRLYTTLRAIDHPKPRMVTETLRSYNKNVIIPTKMEYEAATMTFHDDNSSMASALWKEYRAYYQYEGRIGEANIRANQPTRPATNEYRRANVLVGSEIRDNMNTMPSMGMTLKTNNGRHFFDAINIYDLGADPDSINVYVFMFPVVNSLEHDGLDYEDRNADVGMAMSFDYEGYYHLVGLNNAQFFDAIETYLGFAPMTKAPRVGGHARSTPPPTDATFPVSHPGGDAAIKGTGLAGLLDEVRSTIPGISDGILPTGGTRPIEVLPLPPISGTGTPLDPVPGGAALPVPAGGIPTGIDIGTAVEAIGGLSEEAGTDIFDRIRRILEAEGESR